MKKRNIFYPILVIFLFPILVSFGLSVGACILVAALVALPIYFFCFVLRLPVWQISKRWPETEAIREAKTTALDAAEQISGEGIVLLKNEGHILPISEKEVTKINVFGRCSLQPFYNGSGSAASDLSKCIPILHSLREFGHFELNEDLLNLYTNYIQDKKLSIEGNKKQDVGVVKVNKGGAEFLGKRPDLSLEELPLSVFQSTGLYEDGRTVVEHARDFSDYALIVLGRGGSEGFELKASELRLSEREKEMVQAVCGHFSKVILILNTANPLEMGWLSEYPAIKGVLWMGMPGSVGTKSLAEILRGKVNPSGRLADTWQKDSFAAPACNNFQILNPDGSWNEKSYHLDNYKNGSGYFLHYSEGIYVGYRYFETRYQTDPEYRYEQEVMWPFGYGLSYTEFSQEIIQFERTKDSVLCTVKVKNTGNDAGKEVVQIYVKPPYYGTIEKASVNLVTFWKTDCLEAGAEVVHSFNIALEDLASFDEKEQGAYVLEAGTYEICVMKNAHELIESCSFVLAEKIVFRSDADGKRASDKNPAVVRFQDAKTKGKDLTRTWDKDSSAFKGPDDGCYHASDEVLAALSSDLEIDHNEQNMPAIGVKLSKKMMLQDMMGVPYDDPKWDDFISQLTVGEMCDLCGNGAWHTEKIKRLGVPKRLMPDGSTCICSTLFSGIVMGNAGEGITYPNPVVVASTWNTDMGELMGKAAGGEARTLGYHGWYAPAMNCHRTPFNARNFEYYSEDGLLSGKMAAATVRGAREEGIVCFLKHFALNERESSGRNQLLTYCNEQALREIYLKPFEIAVKDGGASGVMTSFNYIGNTWAGAHKAMLTDVLRGEWGFQGVVSTDACVYPHMDVRKMLVAGGDLSLDSLGGFVGGNIKRVELLKAAKDPGKKAEITRNLQRASKNILFAFAHTNYIEKEED